MDQRVIDNMFHIRYGNGSFFDDEIKDCSFIKKVIKNKYGIDLSISECYEFWRWRSDKYDASWLNIGQTSVKEIEEWFDKIFLFFKSENENNLELEEDNIYEDCIQIRQILKNKYDIYLSIDECYDIWQFYSDENNSNWSQINKKEIEKSFVDWCSYFCFEIDEYPKMDQNRINDIFHQMLSNNGSFRYNFEAGDCEWAKRAIKNKLNIDVSVAECYEIWRFGIKNMNGSVVSFHDYEAIEFLKKMYESFDKE
jgi:hypothetical protein